MAKRVYKYGTGDIIPEGAQYLTTVVEIRGERYVWHYFLVDEDSTSHKSEPEAGGSLDEIPF